MLGLGSISLLTCVGHNLAGLMTLRMLLGICNFRIFVSTILYLSTLYICGELARRICVFYTAAFIGGAFSGLITYGIVQIKHHSLAS